MPSMAMRIAGGCVLAVCLLVGAQIFAAAAADLEVPSSGIESQGAAAPRLIWMHRLNWFSGQSATSVAMGGDGHITVAGTGQISNVPGEFLWVAKFTSDGEPEWLRILNLVASPQVASDAQGSVIVASGGYEWQASKYSSLGNFLWQRSYSIPEWPGQGKWLVDIAVVEHDGAVQVGGNASMCHMGACSRSSAWIAKLNAWGDLLWWSANWWAVER